MRGVCSELTLSIERGFKAIEHSVERRAELVKLSCAWRIPKPPRKIAGFDLGGQRCHRSYWCQCTFGQDTRDNSSDRDQDDHSGSEYLFGSSLVVANKIDWPPKNHCRDAGAAAKERYRYDAKR